MKFHEKLLDLRKKAGMTQSDLAEKMNVSRQAVSRWEMGTAMPDVENLIAMSDLFGVSLDYMLKDKTETPSQDPEKRQPRPDFMTRVKQMKPLEIAAMVVLVLMAMLLIILLMDSSFAGVISLFLIPAVFVIAVKMADYLK